ncbi:MAG TPA: DUF6282 family protein [bacterium]|nr:DUF6282 family protein [bacterium]
MTELDELLRGAWDLHCHCYPELSLAHRARQDDLELVSTIASRGMAGVVLKSHFWPTPERAYYLQRHAPGIHVLSSITLNHIAGGVDPFPVEAAARLGAKVVFFPTWSAKNDQQKNGISAVIRRIIPGSPVDSAPGLIVAEHGRLTAEAQAVLDVSRSFELAVFTGHVSVEESLLICAAARERGLSVVFSHPASPIVGASPEAMRAAADMGAYIEFTCLQMMSVRHPLPPRRVAEMIETLGDDRCVLTTDAFNAWIPPEPELLRWGVGVLRECGIPEAGLRRLIVDNPRTVLGLGDADHSSEARAGDLPTPRGMDD